MININEVIETNRMIEKENLDVRTITVGISLLDCAADTVDEVCSNIKAKIIRVAGKLAETAENIAMEYGIPIVNKRISITPISLVGASACRTPQDYVKTSTRRISWRPSRSARACISPASRRSPTAEDLSAGSSCWSWPSRF